MLFVFSMQHRQKLEDFQNSWVAESRALGNGETEDENEVSSTQNSSSVDSEKFPGSPSWESYQEEEGVVHDQNVNQRALRHQMTILLVYSYFPTLNTLF